MLAAYLRYGIWRAAEATRKLIDAASPQLLVSVGIAGAVNADLEIGDVVVSRIPVC